MLQSGRRKTYMCSECNKTFRTPDDMYLHAEICLLDAFEMEANALMADPSYGDEPIDESEAAPVENYQSIFKPYYEQPRRERKSVASSALDSRLYEENPYSVPPVGRNKSASRVQSKQTITEEYEDEEDAPPQLELAEPQMRKYKRIFPIGEDGKQIRPKMECPTCGLVLYRHNFSTHYRIHTGELPFQCSFCDKRFRTTSALTVHTRCHTGDKPYMCPHCEYTCITKRNLDRHIINNHVKRTRRTRFVRMASGHTAILRRRGRPPMAAYSNYENRVLLNEEAEILDGAAADSGHVVATTEAGVRSPLLENRNNNHRLQYGYARRRGSYRRYRERPAIIGNTGATRRQSDELDRDQEHDEHEPSSAVVDSGNDVTVDEEDEEEAEEEEVVTYHVTEEEMERIMRAAAAEGVVIQQEEDLEEEHNVEGTLEDSRDASALILNEGDAAENDK